MAIGFLERQRFYAAIASAVIVIAGCKVGPNYARPNYTAPPAFLCGRSLRKQGLRTTRRSSIRSPSQTRSWDRTCRRSRPRSPLA